MPAGPDYKYEFPVEQGVAIPPRPGRGGSRRFSYPWPRMEVGDSFAAPADRVVSVVIQVSCRNKKCVEQYDFRLLGDHVRVWRTE